MRALAGRLGLENVRFVTEWHSGRSLADRMHRADVCLGIFGTSEKAASVIPLKAVAALGGAGEDSADISPEVLVGLLAEKRSDLEQALAAVGAGSEGSPLGVSPYEAYQFAAAPFSIRLAASPANWPILTSASADVCQAGK